MIHKPIRTIEKAIEKLTYRLSHGRYEPNSSDVEVVNFIIEWANDCKKSSLSGSSDLTKKLFIHLFSIELDKAKGDANKAQKVMSELLKYPLNFYEEQFSKQYDDFTMFNFLDNNGITDISIGFEQLTPDKQKEFEDILMIPDRSDKVLKSLRNTMAEFLIKFSR